MLVNVLVLTVFILCLIVLFSPNLEKSKIWRATVTPLASIIGSGFLVSAPLLYLILGSLSVFGMLIIVLIAYMIGGVIRYNILFSEPLFKNERDTAFNALLREVESFSNLALSFAYIISVAFYLRLLSSFIFAGFFERNLLYENVLTSLILLFIGISGLTKGLEFLEFLERYSVNVKLSVIVSFLISLIVFDVENFNFKEEYRSINFHTFEILGGILLIVQGFETSKYIGKKYSPEEKVRSMKIAQIISGFIYVLFTLLVIPVFYSFDIDKIDETTIIIIATTVSTILGTLIKVGALMSQFSAAVADTIGSGGLIEQETGGRVSSKVGYLFTTIIGLILIWSANIFEIIAYASKAFAFYYLLQTVIAFSLSVKRKERGRSLNFLFLIIILSFITLFGKSVE